MTAARGETKTPVIDGRTARRGLVLITLPLRGALALRVVMVIVVRAGTRSATALPVVMGPLSEMARPAVTASGVAFRSAAVPGASAPTVARTTVLGTTTRSFPTRSPGTICTSLHAMS